MSIVYGIIHRGLLDLKICVKPLDDFIFFYLVHSSSSRFLESFYCFIPPCGSCVRRTELPSDIFAPHGERSVFVSLLTPIVDWPSMCGAWLICTGTFVRFGNLCSKRPTGRLFPRMSCGQTCSCPSATAARRTVPRGTFKSFPTWSARVGSRPSMAK